MADADTERQTMDKVSENALANQKVQKDFVNEKSNS